jgi:hypothetical protein
VNCASFKLRGQINITAVFGLDMIAYNLIRQSNLLKPLEAMACPDRSPEIEARRVIDFSQ